MRSVAAVLDASCRKEKKILVSVKMLSYGDQAEVWQEVGLVEVPKGTVH